ncbi:Peptidase U49, Lit peptidase [Flavobacterium beibuense]|uniref:Peptidase U49, Lit peptidase n=1 Tax=Flavobacterium beibuense TaxID=657326 RepID=A0A444WEL5_9FLAO|nr:Peptidase U49, Lit peptidase [Flavobacterium beibuense]
MHKLFNKVNWIWQKKGPINHFRPRIHNGTQPVRVVHHMLVYMFQNAHPQFLRELSEEIAKGKIAPKLELRYGRDSIRQDDGRLHTPRVDLTTKTIELHETFLSFLWCCTYSIYVQYLEKVDFPRMNRLNGRVIYPINEENIQKAREMFDYARLLIVNFEDWDKDNLPNPEIYLAEQRTYPEQTNLYYTEAVKFILGHEYTHLKLHADQIDANTPNSSYLVFEAEADNNAIDILIAGLFPKNHFAADAQKLAVCIGIIIGILSMFYFTATTSGTRHPNMEDRLTNALERLPIEDDHEAWGIACIGLQMWDEQFNLQLTWENDPVSYREQYYRIIEQIKAQQ